VKGLCKGNDTNAVTVRAHLFGERRQPRVSRPQSRAANEGGREQVCRTSMQTRGLQ
jgi:hypothetical protein